MRYGFEEIYKRFKKAVVRYDLIKDEKAIMVGLSGGKDSAVLLYTLKQFQPISKYKYRLAAGHIGLGFKNEDVTPLQEFCNSLEVPFYYEKTDIGAIVFEARQEAKPCSLCAKMRRGALNNLAKDNGYDKVALGHHQDDVLETLLLNCFFEGRIASFNPYTYLERKGITVIRPMIYVPESLISYFARKENLPVIVSCCPASGKTKRQRMKEVIQELSEISPEGADRAIGAVEKLFGDRWDGRGLQSNEGDE